MPAAISVTPSGIVRIGCHSHTIAEWTKQGEEIADAEQYAKAQQAEYAGYLKLAKAWVKMKAKG